MGDDILSEIKTRWATRFSLLPAATRDTHDVRWLLSQLELHQILDGVGDSEWRQRAERSEAQASRYWGELCEVVGLLGKVVPEAAVDAPGWVREEIARREKAEARVVEVEGMQREGQRLNTIWVKRVEKAEAEAEGLRAATKATGAWIGRLAEDGSEIMETIPQDVFDAFDALESKKDH